MTWATDTYDPLFTQRVTCALRKRYANRKLYDTVQPDELPGVGLLSELIRAR